MKNNLHTAPLLLLVEAQGAEDADALFISLAESYDPRHGDPEWGPLYQIGPRFTWDGRTFFQVQTFAGSLGTRMMIAIGKGTFNRAILFSLSGEAAGGFELIQPGLDAQHIEAQQLTPNPRLPTRLAWTNGDHANG